VVQRAQYAFMAGAGDDTVDGNESLGTNGDDFECGVE
jgi:hypothetical protein